MIINVIITHADWLTDWQNEEGLEHAQAESAGVPMCVCVCSIDVKGKRKGREY